ncbi:MAG TPA: hypothetical protein VL403_07570 [Candidatus Kryptonia bacterium]|nr:hypothetical protein [Candidatus Kryptonia bacterium]
MKHAAMACLLLLLTAPVAAGRIRIAAPIQVRLVAYVNEKVEGSRPDFEWPVTCRGKRYQLYVLNLQILNGRVTPLDIDAALSPYAVKFIVTGNKTTLQRFTNAPPRQQVLIRGYLRLDRSGRYLMVDSVESAYLPTPTPGT